MPSGQPAQLPGYCHPFSGRPSASTRLLVQAQLTRLLQQSLAELREWTGMCFNYPSPAELSRNAHMLIHVCLCAPPCFRACSEHVLRCSLIYCAATLRVAAARLLRVSLIYGEAEVLPLLPTVLLGLQSAVADDDAGLLGARAGRFSAAS